MGEKTSKIRLWAVIFWLAVWQLAAMGLARAYPHGSLLLASPAAVLYRLGQLAVTAAFWQTVGWSAARIFGGFLLSTLLAVLLAALAAWKNGVGELLAPLVAVIKAVPVASFIILALVWLNSRSLSLFISALMVFPPVYLNVLEGIRRTDGQLLEMARVFRVPFSRRLRYIYLPQIMPLLPRGSFSGTGALLESRGGGGGHRPACRFRRGAAVHRQGVFPDAGSVCVDRDHCGGVCAV